MRHSLAVCEVVATVLDIGDITSLTRVRSSDRPRFHSPSCPSWLRNDGQ